MDLSTKYFNGKKLSVPQNFNFAYKDAEDFIWFVSRKDDIIKSAGYRISPDYSQQKLKFREVQVIKKVLFTLLILFTFLSCSIKYDTSVEVSDVVPEFIFEDTIITRYEDKRLEVRVEAGRMEDYKNSNANYAENVQFTAYDAQKKVTTEGSCGLLYADSDNEYYELYNNIELNSVSDKTKFYADSLRWNQKSEQLVTGKSDVVKIEKEDTVMFGSGFSASGVSKTFQFEKAVSGDIETK